MKNWFARFWRNNVVGVTVDEIAEAIHDADDRAGTAWPTNGLFSFDKDGIRYAGPWEVETRRRQARVAAKLLGIKLADAS